MKNSVWIAGLAVATCSAAIALAQHGMSHTILSPQEIKWAPGPPSLPPGAQAAVLYGDPTKEGMFVMRLSLPAGYRIAPHTHPRPEIVTVISGTFHLGTGQQAVDAQMKPLPAGSFFALEPNTPHYAGVQQHTVVQISSTGPWSITYVNPADDPRNKKPERG